MFVLHSLPHFTRFRHFVLRHPFVAPSPARAPPPLPPPARRWPRTPLPTRWMRGPYPTLRKRRYRELDNMALQAVELFESESRLSQYATQCAHGHFSVARHYGCEYTLPRLFGELDVAAFLADLNESCRTQFSRDLPIEQRPSRRQLLPLRGEFVAPLWGTAVQSEAVRPLPSSPTPHPPTRPGWLRPCPGPALRTTGPL